jgi:integrase/recombinase XerD
LLGHASPTTTARYAHLTQVTEADSLTAINHLLGTLQIDLGGGDDPVRYR